MSKISKRAKILNWFIRSELPLGVNAFDDLASLAVRDSLSVDQLQADTYAYKNRRSLWNYFSRQRDLERKKGIYPVAYIVDSYARRIESAPSLIFRRADKKSIRISGRLAMRSDIYQKISTLTDRVYEALCCLACQSLGASKIHLTPPGNEGGIDFLALVENKRGFPKCSGLNKFRIVGQAKKYAGPVQVGGVRDFNDTVADVRRLSPTVKGHLPSWFRESSTPIIGWLVGHNGFQSGSESKARMNGIMLLDSQVITEIIAFSPGIGSSETGKIVAQNMVSSCNDILKIYS